MKNFTHLFVFILPVTSAPDFFSRALFSPLASQHIQTYYSLTVYFFLAFALCGLLAGLAYLFSISTAQETEKRSEYECGFAPFDSATRLPFDVHFYLVGILFLIFDVEVALLFPWVLTLRTTGWFGFYLMLAFLAILSLGFLYEWKRGALIWPTRYSKTKNSSLPLLALTLYDDNDPFFKELFDALTAWPCILFTGVFVLHHLAILYMWAQTYIKGEKALVLLQLFWFIGASWFFASLYYSYILSLVLAVIFCTSLYLENNIFWPVRSYRASQSWLFSLPVRSGLISYHRLVRFWLLLFALPIPLALFFCVFFYVPGTFHHLHPFPIREEYADFDNIFYFRLASATWWLLSIVYVVFKFFFANLQVAVLFVLLPFFHEVTPLVSRFGSLVDANNNHYALFGYFLLFLLAFSAIFNYIHGGSRFIFRGNLYQKFATDPSPAVTMAYLWKTLALTAALFFISNTLFTFYAAYYPVFNAVLATAQMEIVAAVNYLITSPGRIYIFLTVDGPATFMEGLHLIADKGEIALKVGPLLLWKYKLHILWTLFLVRGTYFTSYMFDMETWSWFGKWNYVLSTLIYVYIMPFVNLYYLIRDLIGRIKRHYVTYYAPAAPEVYVQLTNTSAESKTTEEAKPSSTPQNLFTLLAITVVDELGNPTGEDYASAFSRVNNLTARAEHMSGECTAAVEQNTQLTVLFWTLSVVGVGLLAYCIYLGVKVYFRTPIPADTPPQLIKKYTVAPRKAPSKNGPVYAIPAEEVVAKVDEVIVAETFLDKTDELFLLNDTLDLQTFDIEENSRLLSSSITLLAFVCLCLFGTALYLARKLQRHNTLLNGILTDGALVVTPAEKKEAPSKKFTPPMIVNPSTPASDDSDIITSDDSDIITEGCDSITAHHENFYISYDTFISHNIPALNAYVERSLKDDFMSNQCATAVEKFNEMQAVHPSFYEALSNYLVRGFVRPMKEPTYLNDILMELQELSVSLDGICSTLLEHGSLAFLAGPASSKTALLFPLLAEILLFLLICLVIAALSLKLGKEHNKRYLAYLSWKVLSAGLFGIAFIYLAQFIFDTESSTILSGYFAASRTITFLKFITLVSAAFVLDASENYMRQHSRHLLEYPLMVALTTLFMLLLVSANHVMSAFFCLVGFSLGLYVLVLYDVNRRPSREAGLKYYYLSTFSSGLILYGIMLIYTLTGTGNFDELFLILNTKLQLQENPLLGLAVLFILAGFFFKLSAFPGHLWAADVYEGSPSPVTAFFMLPVKIVVLGGFIRLFLIALAPLASYWLPLVTLAVIISIVWGAFASAQEKKVRRFLAYASINQMGFLLMGFTTDSDEGYQAALLYIAVYAVMTCAFLTIFLSARRQDGSELLYISDFRTLASQNWLIGWSLAVILFSMAGIPPLAGFFAKYLVLLHAFEKNLLVEVVVGLATSLISTYYYLRIIKIVKFEQSDGAMPSSPCLTTRRQTQLFIAEAALWSFIVFAPALLGFTYGLALTQGPAGGDFFA